MVRESAARHSPRTAGSEVWSIRKTVSVPIRWLCIMQGSSAEDQHRCSILLLNLNQVCRDPLTRMHSGKAFDGAPRTPWDRFVADSALEGDGFEPSVPLGHAFWPGTR